MTEGILVICGRQAKLVRATGTPKHLSSRVRAYSYTIRIQELNRRRRKRGYPGNCEGIESRTGSPRPSYRCTRWSKPDPSHCGRTRVFQSRCTGITETPFDCCRTQAPVYADETTVGGKKEKEFGRPQVKRHSKEVAGHYQISGGVDDSGHLPTNLAITFVPRVI
jgi:hypothetical protein